MDTDLDSAPRREIDSAEEVLSEGRRIFTEIDSQMALLEEELRSAGRIDQVNLQMLYYLLNRYNKWLYMLMMEQRENSVHTV